MMVGNTTSDQRSLVNTRLKRSNLHQNLRTVIQTLLGHGCLRVDADQLEALLKEIPIKWQRHGDLVLFPDSSFVQPFWHELSSSFWTDVAQVLKAKRLGVMGRTKSNGFRQPSVTLLLGTDGWTEHSDNHVRYCFNVTRTMFSSGNITEKMRVAKFDCSGQVVVDLYAGIGYFTLPYLVHANAAHVHACEWNPDAVAALRKGLHRNKVADRCTVYEGDNSKAGLVNIADRVNLGLLPSSKAGWSVACVALKQSGGFLHIHDCLSSKGQGREISEQLYMKETAEEIKMILSRIKPAIQDWEVRVLHLERVKSYAPHITHIVLDLHCIPKAKGI